jgi:hypothetical protein
VYNLTGFNNKSGNTKNTIIKRLKVSNPSLASNKIFINILKQHFTKPKYTKNEVEKICKLIKIELEKSNG